MPLPMNSTAKRLGKAGADPVSANAESEGSHGSAMVTPAPRRTARREILGAELRVGSGMLTTFPGLLRIWIHARIEYAAVEELRAGDDSLYQGIEAVSVGGQARLHFLHEEFVGEQERAVQSVRQQLAAEI